MRLRKNSRIRFQNIRTEQIEQAMIDIKCTKMEQVDVPLTCLRFISLFLLDIIMLSCILEESG